MFLGQRMASHSKPQVRELNSKWIQQDEQIFFFHFNKQYSAIFPDQLVHFQQVQG